MPDDSPHHAATPVPLAARRPAAPLTGSVAVPGDKSVSHRALMFGALAVGRTEITGLLEGEDVLATAAALRAMGAAIERTTDGHWFVDGVGVGGLGEPDDVLDLGNSGTSARLLLGILATHPFTAFVTGDASLRQRPMRRVTDPLAQFGAQFWSRDGGRLPLAVHGTADPVPIEYRLPVPSAQVKSAVLLAGLNTPGETSVIETQPSRDHTERMLGHFGALIAIEPLPAGGRRIAVTGQPELTAAPVVVPGDISSAGFPLVAALIVPGSDVTIANVGLNPTRAGLLDCLREMGADIALQNERVAGGEPVADLRVRAGELRGADIPPERAPTMIDEYPILAVAAACARGRTIMRGVAELRVKESDRLAGIAEGLQACGAKVVVEGDDLIVEGDGRPPKGGAAIATRLDHRIAMAFLVLGLGTREPVRIDDARPVATSFPDFVPLMARLGAHFDGMG
ncbi:MAG TPA: 3-phosphoshikimate 1-carboxyvinyltransferase [Stellaceae bacterium]|nr:3-phosphoshikimate 1-carboxyvinyltransferase [Stellaceae bacterium]